MPARRTNAEASQVILKKGFQALEEYPGAHQPWKMRCLECLEVITPSLNNILHNNNGCKYCAGRAIKESEAIAFMLSKGVKPLEPYKGNKTPWKCECLNCGAVIRPKYNNAQTQHPCKFCSMLVLSKSKIQSAEESAISIMRENLLEPLETYPGSHFHWKCKCLKCGAEVSPKFNSVQQGGGGCKYCAPNYLDPETAVRNMISLGYQPLVEYKSSVTKWRCIHILCGREISVRYNTINGNQGGCRYCAKYGFNYNKPAYFYLLTNSELKAHKVGIGTTSNIRKDRVKSHQKHGWTLVKRLDFEVGEQAFQLEQRILTWLRIELKLPPYLSKHEMPQRGETETVGSDSISLEEIWKKVLEIHKSDVQA
jgi:hypothetical protein